MGVQMKKTYPFAVDTWTEGKPHHFLTHAHKDHTSGIESHGGYPIYCSLITQRIVLRRHPKLRDSIFKILEIGEPKLISDDDQAFTVTAFDANHCPGAIMLLFEGSFGKVLHTGDCRLTMDCLNKLPPQYVCKGMALDCLYLDCTFGKEAMVMPTREEAVQQVIRCIWNHSRDSLVNLACDILGQENLLHAVSESFGMKIYVDKDKLPEYHADLMMVAPDLLTVNKASTRFHICEGFPKLYERASRAIEEARKMGKPEPLFIRPSAQWYTYEERLQGAGSGILSFSSASSRHGSRRHRRVTAAPTEAEKDPNGVWHVCYSMHSSRGELEKALKIINPQEVISTTPHCGATELFQKQATPTENDRDKAADICPELVVPSVSSPPARPTRSPEKCVLEERELERGKKEYSCSPLKRNREDWVDDSPQRGLPLFGHARHGVPPSPPLSFPSPCAVPAEIQLDSGPLLSPFSLPAESYVLQLTGSPLEASYGRDPSSPRNANSRRSKRLFGGLDGLGDDAQIAGTKASLNDEEVSETAQPVKCNLSESLGHNSQAGNGKADAVLGLSASQTIVQTSYRKILRVPLLQPLPSLLDFL